mgnify:CR=1 FL=1
MKKLSFLLLFIPFITLSQNSNLPDDVKKYISEINEQMNNVDNPLIATYLGSEIGDYFYFMFEGKDGNIFDFGNGNNDYGIIPFGENDLEINSDLIGKKFTIYWKFSPSYFYCCEGRMDEYIADLPSISYIDYYND